MRTDFLYFLKQFSVLNRIKQEQITLKKRKDQIFHKTIFRFVPTYTGYANIIIKLYVFLSINLQPKAPPIFCPNP